MLGPTTEFAGKVADLCEVFLGVLQQNIDALSNQLLASIQDSDLDDLYERAEPLPPVGAPETSADDPPFAEGLADAPRDPEEPT